MVDLPTAELVLVGDGAECAWAQATRSGHLLRSRVGATDEVGLVVDAAQWLDPAASLLTFDRQVHAAEDDTKRALPLRVVVRGDDADQLMQAAIGVGYRYQRLWPRHTTSFGELSPILIAHRALHDCKKPLVRADYEHSVDVWQWVLRLCPGASVALQVAALFHDIERLLSEPDKRVEQHAADYLAFKLAHAAGGAALLMRTLTGVCDPALVARAAELVTRHEQPGNDDELRCLNDADALSFFSLNSAGFLAYYGPAHTEKKVRYTVGRLCSELARSMLGVVRLEPFVAHQLRVALDAARSELPQPPP